MPQETDRLMDVITGAITEALDESRDEQNAGAMYDHLYETLTELGYSQEVAEDVAMTARNRLLELCGA